MIIWVTLVMVLISFELEPPKRWYHQFIYLLTWPTIVGRWMNKLVNKEQQ